MDDQEKDQGEDGQGRALGQRQEECHRPPGKGADQGNQLEDEGGDGNHQREWHPQDGGPGAGQDRDQQGHQKLGPYVATHHERKGVEAEGELAPHPAREQFLKLLAQHPTVLEQPEGDHQADEEVDQDGDRARQPVEQDPGRAGDVGGQIVGDDTPPAELDSVLAQLVPEIGDLRIGAMEQVGYLDGHAAGLADQRATDHVEHGGDQDQPHHQGAQHRHRRGQVPPALEETHDGVGDEGDGDRQHQGQDHRQDAGQPPGQHQQQLVTDENRHHDGGRADPVPGPRRGPGGADRRGWRRRRRGCGGDRALRRHVLSLEAPPGN